MNFHYPCLLSFFHEIFSSAGAEVCYVLAERRRIQKRGDGVDGTDKFEASSFSVGVLDELTRTNLDATNDRRMWFLSMLFSLNIAMGNVSLQHVSINFNQIMRSLIPALVIFVGTAFGRSTSWKKIVAICPVVVGVAVATYGDISYTNTGFLLMLLSVVIAALRVVASGEMVKDNDELGGMHSIDLLGKLPPRAAMQCLVLSVLSGELAEVRERWDVDTVSLKLTLAILATAILAFALNVSFFEANRRTSPLTLCVASNLKQTVMMCLGTAIFGTVVTPLNGAGIVVVLAGSMAYGYVSVKESETKTDETKRREKETGSKPEAEIKGYM